MNKDGEGSTYKLGLDIILLCQYQNIHGGIEIDSIEYHILAFSFFSLQKCNFLFPSQNHKQIQNFMTLSFETKTSNITKSSWQD